MRCWHCRRRYSAADAQPAPGGSSAPGVFFLIATLSLAAAAALLLAGRYPPLASALLALAAWTSLLTAIAWYDCRGPAGLDSHGGGRCRHCGGENPVWPWSL